MMVVEEEAAEQDSCLAEVGKEELMMTMVEPELVERGVVEELVLMEIVLLEAVVLEPMVKMVRLAMIQALEVMPMVIHNLLH